MKNEKWSGAKFLNGTLTYPTASWNWWIREHQRTKGMLPSRQLCYTTTKDKIMTYPCLVKRSTITKSTTTDTTTSAREEKFVGQCVKNSGERWWLCLLCWYLIWKYGILYELQVNTQHREIFIHTIHTLTLQLSTFQISILFSWGGVGVVVGMCGWGSRPVTGVRVMCGWLGDVAAW